MEPLWRQVRPADIATLLNGLAGLLSMWLAGAGHVHEAALMILIAVLLDGVDGAVARLGGGGGPLGRSIDALCDAVSFAAAPAVLVAAHVDYALLWIPVLSFSFAALRLARFLADTESDRSRHFHGLSSPGAAVLVAGAVLAWPGAVAAITLLGALLMVTRIPYPKLRGGLGIVAGGLIVAVLIDALSPFAIANAAFAMLAFLGVYILLGPMYLARTS